MYQHQIVESLITFQKNLSKIPDEALNKMHGGQESAKEINQYARAYENSVKAILKSEVFFCGKAEDFTIPFEKLIKDNAQINRFGVTNTFQGIFGENIRLPYKNCFFEYTVHDIKMNTDVKYGMLVREEHERHDILVCSLFLNMKNEKSTYNLAEWGLSPVIYMASVGKPITEEPYAKGIIKQHPALGDFLIKTNYPALPFPMLLLKGDIGKNLFKEALVRDRNHFFLLNMILLLLNCKNISTQTTYPSEKLNKKRRKNNKPELLTYKTLFINIIRKTKLDTGKEHIRKTTTESLTRAHLCRGHFKHFTKEKPLMGKHVGVYWWDAQLRGDKTAGKIIKDYELKTKE